jgi:CRP-like cAMP-binding protein
MINIHEAHKNALLKSLSSSTLSAWLPFMDIVELPLGKTLVKEGDRFTHVYFPVSALLSLVHILKDGSTVEAAVIGNDGMAGVSMVLGDSVSMHHIIVQTAGTSLQLEAQKFKQLYKTDYTLQAILLRYLHALFMQVSQTAVCNRHHTMDQQLCRWLLMIQERLPTGDLIMTQEIIAMMLGVRRESVTVAAMKLQNEKIIQYTRGRIKILDRSGLEDRACECYEVLKLNYRTLLVDKISES